MSDTIIEKTISATNKSNSLIYNEYKTFLNRINVYLTNHIENYNTNYSILNREFNSSLTNNIDNDHQLLFIIIRLSQIEFQHIILWSQIEIIKNLKDNYLIIGNLDKLVENTLKIFTYLSIKISNTTY